MLAQAPHVQGFRRSEDRVPLKSHVDHGAVVPFVSQEIVCSDQSLTCFTVDRSAVAHDRGDLNSESLSLKLSGETETIISMRYLQDIPETVDMAL